MRTELSCFLQKELFTVFSRAAVDKLTKLVTNVFYNRNESTLNLLELHNDSFFILKLLYSQSNLCCIIFQLSM